VFWYLASSNSLIPVVTYGVGVFLLTILERRCGPIRGERCIKMASIPDKCNLGEYLFYCSGSTEVIAAFQDEFAEFFLGKELFHNQRSLRF